jgi:hypothetical protein
MLALIVALLQVTGVGTVDGMRVTDVRLDDAFRQPGSDSSGLVVTVNVDRLAKPGSIKDFVLIIYNDQGLRAGEIVCRTVRSASGTGSRTERKTVDAPGTYEFVFVVGPSVKQGALLYGENRPDVARRPIGSFKVPWP